MEARGHERDAEMHDIRGQVAARIEAILSLQMEMDTAEADAAQRVRSADWTPHKL